MTSVIELMEVILYVEDMNRQVSFYRDILGLRVKQPGGIEDFSTESWVELDTGACTLAFHAGGKRRFGQDSPKIVFRVADILAAHRALHERDVPMGEVFQAAPGVWVSNGADPEGNQFSIESHDEGR